MPAAPKPGMKAKDLKRLRGLRTTWKSPVRPDVVEVDGLVKVCGPDEFMSYYGPQGYPFIHPNLERFADSAGGFWEWENPEAIVFYYT